jgi:putative NADH-flavin reductase
MKKVIVFGASGKVGKLVIDELLSRNYQVTAFIYGDNPFENSENLNIITGNVKSTSDVLTAIKEQDVVVSVLGSWGTKTKDILSEGIVNIISGMKKEKITRIVSLTGSDAFIPGEKPRYIRNISHTLLSIIAKKIMFDGELHIERLVESDLDWTVVRSPVMSDRGIVDFELNENPCSPWESVNRLAVAKSMVKILEEDLFIQDSPFLHRKK